ncbi:MAG TPA: dihydroorotate dehydrogenase-like protein [Candidatus Dormibacteraeota bacterium]|nr:dihydroorotate dehydrogenase-like protein [Candidatus Dormibacteraeota bacterium]
MTQPDLRTTYLGLELSNPVVASASPLSASLDALRRLEEAGAGAVVLQSLFEEQIEHEELHVHHVLEAGAGTQPEACAYFPELDDYNTGPRAYLDHLEAARSVLDVPVIASLNGSSMGGWVRYAGLIEEAGAHAIELNAHFVPTDAAVSGAEVEARYLDLVAAVRAATRLPMAVKIGPYFSSLPDMARRLVRAGADGLVLFNRFLEPDIDLDALAVVPTLHLSTAEELRLPLRWIAVLNGQVGCSLAATTGVHAAEDALKLLLAGADVTMMASALLRHGPERLREVREGIAAWLADGEYESVAQMRGSMSRRSVAHPDDYERANYMRALTGYVVGR